MTRRRLAALLLGCAGLLAIEAVARIILPAPSVGLSPPPLIPYLMFDEVPVNSEFRKAALDVPMENRALPPKPPGEVRIDILGGSVAYGLGASRREACYDRLLEARLMAARRPGDARTFRVINRAKPGYNTSQCLIALEFQALEDAPDWVVLVDGFNDLAIPVLGGRPGDPFLLDAFRERMQPMSWRGWGLSLTRRIRTLDLLKMWSTGPRLPSPKSLTREDLGEIRRIAARNLGAMAALLRSRGVKGLLVAEPIVSQKPAAPEEKDYLARSPLAPALAEAYPPHARALLEAGTTAGWTGLDATDLFQNVPERRFMDMVHLLDTGQEALAERIASVLAPALEGH